MPVAVYDEGLEDGGVDGRGWAFIKGQT